ncbi:MAG TPA: serine/threonine-protein kinase, partial [Tepidisphaeraceae bacterium]|nr:serine/threonine-protein kinase [Tepidisphaeraceae bacterium]
KTAFFLREIGKGLQYLHECGIVHRDLKPGNIFYENGYVKIGDYGLSKAISATQHSGQTITVGTVHYMAPEISMGKYDKEVDIYALGAVLHEMLTGQVPYLGSSPGEILMKHMTAEPNVSGLEEPFATVIKKAMHRDPAQRYQSVQEMVEAVFGSEHVQQSVSCFSPDSLTMVAERVAQRVAVGGGSATPPPLPANRAATAEPGMPNWADRFGQNMERFGDRMGQWGEDFGRRMADLGARMGGPRPEQTAGGAGAAIAEAVRRDPLSKKQRALLSLSIMVILAGAMAMFRPDFVRDGDIFPIMILGFAAIGGAAAGILLAVYRVAPQLAQESHAVRRFAVGGMGTAGLLLFSLPMFLAAPGSVQRELGRMIVPLLAALFFTDWAACTAADRRERLLFGHAIRIAVIGAVVGLFFGASPQLLIGVLAGVSLVVQMKSPWDPVAARGGKSEVSGGRPTARGGESEVPGGRPTARGGAVDGPETPRPPAGAMVPPPLPALRPQRVTAGRPVPRWARIIWLVHLPITLSVGLMLLIMAGMAHNMQGDEFAALVGFGLGLLLLMLLCLTKTLQQTFTGWWPYLIRPLLLWLCAQTILISACLLGNAHLNSDETAIGVFFIVFPAALMLTLAFIRGGGLGPVAMTPVPPSGAWPTAPAADAVNPPVSPFAPPAAPAMLTPEPMTPANTPSGISVAAVITHSRNFLLASMGWLLLLATIILGLTVAVDLPGMIAAGIPEPRIAENLNREAQTMQVASWERLLRTLLVVASGIGVFLSVIFLMLSRRTAGVAHMSRSVGGVAVVVVALFLLHAGLAGHWTAIRVAAGPGVPPAPVEAMGPMLPQTPVVYSGTVSVPASIDAFLGRAQGVPVFFAAVFMILAMALLLWPAPRNPVVARA